MKLCYVLLLLYALQWKYIPKAYEAESKYIFLYRFCYLYLIIFIEYWVSIVFKWSINFHYLSLTPKGVSPIFELCLIISSALIPCKFSMQLFLVIVIFLNPNSLFEHIFMENSFFEGELNANSDYISQLLKILIYMITQIALILLHYYVIMHFYINSMKLYLWLSEISFTIPFSNVIIIYRVYSDHVFHVYIFIDALKY